MWIRSQDKKTITKVITVTLETNNGVYGIRGFNENSSIKYMYLGTYSTEEKALKVLDMIEKRVKIIQGTRIKAYTNGYLESLGIFQMPQDNEV